MQEHNWLIEALVVIASGVLIGSIVVWFVNIFNKDN